MAIQRTKSRKLALQILYQNQFLLEDKPISSRSSNRIEELVLSEQKNKSISSPLTLEESDYCRKTLSIIYENKKTIDDLIGLYSKNWKFNRINLVDLNIMRIAISEMLYHPEIPNKVSINEALELSKIFGTKDSSSFINGILDKILKSHQPKKPE